MRKSRCKRNQTGGGLGGVVEFKPDSVNELVNNGLAWTRGGSCLEATRPGFLSGGVTPRGLPGMSGGRRRRGGRKGSRKGKGSRKNRRNNIFQSGGRYGFDPSLASTIGGTPSTSGYAPVSSIPCEASRTAIPESGAANTLNSRSSELWSGPQLPRGMTGGGAVITGAPITWSATHDQGPSGQNGAQIGMEVSKASYTQNAQAPIQSAAGTNIMINTPSSKIYDSSACTKTGGGSHKRSRKNRKSSRKNRKGSRKH